MNKKLWKGFRSEEKERTLLVGSSLVRDMEQSHLVNTDVVCIPGGKISDVLKTVSQAETDKYARIALVVGGNDCDPRNPSTRETPSETDKINNNETWNRYRSQRNLVTKLRKNSINVYLQNKCSSTVNSQNNGKQFRNTVQPLISHKYPQKNDNIILSKDNKVYTQQMAVATLFNDYFTDIAKNIGSDDVIKKDENLLSCLLKHDNHESIKCIRNFIKTCDFNTKFSFHTAEVSTIRKHLEKLQPNKATGYDNVTSESIKHRQ